MIINHKTKYDFDSDISSHIENVKKKMMTISGSIWDRGIHHDESKLHDPEYSAYKEFTPKLADIAYQSPEYKLITHDPEFRSAIDHHKSINPHHPEYYEDGVNGMDLIDVVEMLCDWKAASERHKNASWEDGFKINCEKYNIGPQLSKILWNTYQRYLSRSDHE